MRTRLGIAVLLALVGGGCDPRGDDRAAARVDRCTERMLQRVHFEDFPDASRAQIRRYAERTYCGPFEARGWVYDDGTVSIDAHVHLVDGGSEDCEVAEGGGADRDVPCEELRTPGVPAVIDCALLHHVPRREVEDYLRKLQRSGEVRCDDDTPLGELGAE